VQLRKKLGLPEDGRYLVWLPTFRKNPNIKNDMAMDTSKYSSIGMPLVYSREALEKLDAYLESRNTVIYFKPHPAQDVSGLIEAETKNIRIIRDKDLADIRMPLYDLLAGSDGLITDYSSVFFDYLLADKPIATTTDDMEEWKKMTGFAFDLDAFLDEATTRTATLEELIAFLDALRAGEDTKAAGRKRIREITNTWFDGDSAKRVAAFIKEKIGA
jgi:CDP-glycerol glycerophosphotransferase (TagB/SpsB family)